MPTIRPLGTDAREESAGLSRAGASRTACADVGGHRTAPGYTLVIDAKLVPRPPGFAQLGVSAEVIAADVVP